MPEPDRGYFRQRGADPRPLRGGRAAGNFLPAAQAVVFSAGTGYAPHSGAGAGRKRHSRLSRGLAGMEQADARGRVRAHRRVFRGRLKLQ